MEAEKSNKKKEGQNRYKCLINGCDKSGRLIGQLSGTPLSYCAKHRHYGVRVLDFFIDSLLRYKLFHLLEEARNDLFMENQPKLSKESYHKLYNYVKTMTEKLKEIKYLDNLKKAEVEDLVEGEDICDGMKTTVKGYKKDGIVHITETNREKIDDSIEVGSTTFFKETKKDGE